MKSQRQKKPKSQSRAQNRAKDEVSVGLAKAKVPVSRSQSRQPAHPSAGLKQESVRGYRKLRVLGKGAYGKVWLVVDSRGKEFAMKEMSKSRILRKDSVRSILQERKLLQSLFHPFLVNMLRAFQDSRFLYLILEYEPNGDLRSQMLKRGGFCEEQTRFVLANLISAVQYIHRLHIIHRDIKPENIVIGKDNFLKLTDFGISVVQGEGRCDSSGTPGYMSPEAICSHEQTLVSDYFALGVIGYELMLGRRPYHFNGRKEIRDKILEYQAGISLEEIPEGWTIEAVDFINRLLQRKPQARLGAKGIQEIKEHPFLRSFPWDKLNRKEVKAPFKYKPHVSRLYPSSDEEDDHRLEKDLFAGYTFSSRSTVFTTECLQQPSQ